MDSIREKLGGWRGVGCSIAALSMAQLQGCMDGCSHLGRPGPTTKPVTAQHVVGTWSYGYDGGRVEFLEDGSFHQHTRSQDRASTREQDGRWTLEGSWIKLTPFYFEDWPSKHRFDREADFYLTDFRGPELHVFGGGCPDPATWTIWSRVEALNPK